MSSLSPPRRYFPPWGQFLDLHVSVEVSDGVVEVEHQEGSLASGSHGLLCNTDPQDSLNYSAAKNLLRRTREGTPDYTIYYI